MNTEETADGGGDGQRGACMSPPVLAKDAPAHLSLAEAEAWASGYNAATERCELIAWQHGRADGLIIATKIREHTKQPETGS